MFKPMLSGKLTEPAALSYPVLASPKLDGVRCLIMGGRAISRNLKPIPNVAVSSILGGLPAMDGELIIGPPTAADVFQRTMSGVMSREGVPEFRFWVFDVLTSNPSMPFNQRLELAKAWAASCGKNVMHVAHKLIKTPEGLLEYEAQQLLAGYEGIMVRSLDGPYKYGRSTEREGWLLKVKRFEDSEAEVLDFTEKQHNDNELQEDELGRAKRTSHKAGKRNAGVLGSLLVRDTNSGVEFEVGAGFTDADREEWWQARQQRRGVIIKYKFQPVGVKDKPRFPVYLGIRDAADT